MTLTDELVDGSRHSEAAIEQNAKNLEIWAFGARVRQHVVAFFASIECHLVRAAPSMQLRLVQSRGLEYLVVRCPEEKSTESIEVVLRKRSLGIKHCG